MTKYRLNRNNLEWWNDCKGDSGAWDRVICQMDATTVCYRGCSAFEEGMVEFFPPGNEAKTEQAHGVYLTCGCGRMIRLEDA